MADKEWCPRCQKYVTIWMKANMQKKGDSIATTKTYFCYECRIFLKSETDKRAKEKGG